MDDAERDRQAIRGTVDSYLEWVRTGDAALLRRAFHPHATVVNASRGGAEAAVWTIDQFAGGIARIREASNGVHEEIAEAIEIDLARDTATVRVDFQLRIGSETYTGTDHLGCARLGGRWQITQKLYDMDRPLVTPG